MRKIYSIIVCLILIGLCNNSYSQNFIWAKQIGGTDFASWAGLIAVGEDGGGNVYLLGSFKGTVDFDPGPATNILTSSSNVSDIYIARLTSGGSLIWARSIGSTSFDIALDMVVDVSGNLFITGRFTGTVDFDPGPGIFSLTSSGNDDIFVCKFNSVGNFIWAKSFTGTSFAASSSIALDINGNVYIAGDFGGTVDFDPGPGLYNFTNSSTWASVFVSKLDTLGNFVWAKQFPGTGGVGCQAIGIAPNGNIYTGGTFSSVTDFDPGVGTFNLTPAGSGDIFISKLDPLGNLIWVKQMGGTSGEGCTSLIIDAGENVCATGSFSGTADFDPGAGVYNLVSVGNSDIFISKLDVSGNFLWAKPIGSPGLDASTSIKVDGTGNIYTVGNFETTADFDPGVDSYILTSLDPPNRDIFVSKLDASGNFLRAMRLGSSAEDDGNCLALTSDGHLYIGGTFNGNVDFDPGIGANYMSTFDSFDLFLEKLNSCLGPPSYVTAAGPTTFCSSGSVVLNANTGSGLSYQWVNNGNNITGATSSSYTATSPGNYFCFISNSSCGSAASNVITVTVNSAPSAVITASGPTTFCAPGSVLLNANTGPGLFYQWLLNNLPISGAINSSYGAATSGSYSCLVMNACGNITSNSITVNALTLPPAAVINANGPTNFCTPGLVTLSANTGAGLSYQWRLNGVNISGATSVSYTATAAGNYDCIVSNACGSNFSNIITASVSGPCGIGLQFTSSANDRVTINDNASYALGLGDFTMEAWIKASSSQSSSVPIIASKRGATSNGFLLYLSSGKLSLQMAGINFGSTSINLRDNMCHHVAVTRAANAIKFYVDGALVTTITVVNYNINSTHALWLGRDEPASAPFNGLIHEFRFWNVERSPSQILASKDIFLSGSEAGLIGYWKMDEGTGQTVVDYSPINNSGVLGSSTSAESIDPAYTPACMTNACPLPPATVTAAGSTSVCTPATVTLNANTGSGLTYQWRLNGGDISGATASSYVAAATGSYNCIVSNSCGSATSNAVVVTVDSPPPASITAAGPITFCSPGSVTLNANTNPGLSYQWRVNGINISGATAASYSVTATGTYDCIVSNTCGNVTSNAIAVDVVGSYAFIVQPNAAAGNDGFLSNYPGQTNLNYGTRSDLLSFAWTSNGIPHTVRGLIHFDLSSIPVNAVVQQATLTLYNDPTSAGGSDHSSMSGSNVSWLQKVTSPWLENTVTWDTQPISTTTNQVTLPQSTSPNQDYDITVSTLVQDMVNNPAMNYGFLLRLQTESYYRRLVFASSDNADATNWPKLMVVYTVPLTATITAGGPTSFCSSGSVTLNASAGTSFQWRLNGTDIPGATASSYIATATGNYDCIVSSICGNANSNAIAVNVILPGQYTWIQQPDFGPGIREQAIGFSIGSKGYAGTGRNPAIQNDFWEFDPVTNAWTQKANVPGVVRHGAIGFSIGTRGYAGLGWTTSSGQLNDFYEYDPSTNTWTAKLNFPGGARYSSVGISIRNKGYVGTGHSPLTNDWWEYDPVLNTWTQRASQPATVRQAATGFSLDGFGYIGTGYNNGTHYSDFWRYDPDNNSWTQVANYPGGARRGVSSFTIGTHAYVGMGYNDINYFNDFWEYDPASNSWTQIVNSGGIPRYACFSFSVNGNGYVGTGSYNGIINPQSTSGVWKLNVPCAIEASITPSGPVAICSAGSVVLSTANNPNNTYQWRLNGVDIAGATSSSYTAIAAGNYDCALNCACGSAISNAITVTVNPAPPAAINAAGPTTFCTPGAVILNANTGPGLLYQWRLNSGNIPGATASSYSAALAGNYDCIVSNTCGSAASNVITVTVNSAPSANISAGGPVTFCSPGSVTLNANTGAGLSHQWRLNGGNIAGATVSSYNATSGGNYDCIVSNSCGSTTSNIITVTGLTIPATPGTITGQATGVCASTRTYFITPVPDATSYIWTIPAGASISNGQGTSSVNVAFTNSFSSGNVSIVATNICGSSGVSSLTVSGIPAQPGTINGPSSVCHNQNNVIYNIAAVTGATSYTWTVPPGTQIKTGQGTVQIKVRFGNSAGNITVRANNACGQSPVRTLAIAMPCREEISADNFDVSLYPNPATDRLNVICYPLYGNELLRIFNAVGESVLKSEIRNPESEIDINSLPAGIYFVEIISGQQKKVIKFIKQE